MPAGRMKKLYTGSRTKAKKKSVNAKQNADIKKLKKDVRNLKGLDELKFKDKTAVTTTLNLTTGTFFDLNPLGPWDTNSATANADRQSEREGNKVTTKSITVHGKVGFKYELDTLDRDMCPTRVRILIIQYQEEDPTNPEPLSVKDFLASPNSGQSLALSWVDALYNLNKTRVFRILSDKKYTLEPCYWNYSQAAVANNDHFSGFSTVNPSQININTKVYANKMYEKGKIHWKQGSTNVTPYKGRVVMFAVTDRNNTIDFVQAQRHEFMDAV